MNFEVPKVSSEELLLSRPIRRELSRLCCHGHSLLLCSYLHRISQKENSACSACGHPLQDLNHLLLDCPASEPLCKSIFGSSLSLFLIYGPDLGVWPDCWVFAKFLRTSIPRKRSGSTTTTTTGPGRCVPRLASVGWPELVPTTEPPVRERGDAVDVLKYIFCFISVFV